MYSHNFYGGGGNNFNKRLSQSKDYVRPKQTKQDSLTNEQIKEALRGYIPVEDVNTIQIGTHVRYFKKFPDGDVKYRSGGNLIKCEPDKPYVIVNNGQYGWSVQKKNAKFFRKLTMQEEKESIMNEVKEIKNTYTEKIIQKDEIIEENRHEILKLQERLNRYKNQ